MNPNGYDTLKALHRKVRAGFPQPLSLRTHRALSWLQRAEQEAEDLDAQFIFLWISLNALYGRDIPNRKDNPEAKLYRMFLQRLINADQEQCLTDLLSERNKTLVGELIENQYVYQPFWDHQAGRISKKQWSEGFAKNVKAGQRAVRERNLLKVLEVVLERLYVLRNQVIHGNSTWASGVNRSQIESGAEILSFLVPASIRIVLDEPNKDWGEPSYPVVNSE